MDARHVRPRRLTPARGTGHGSRAQRTSGPAAHAHGARGRVRLTGSAPAAHPVRVDPPQRRPLPARAVPVRRPDADERRLRDRRDLRGRAALPHRRRPPRGEVADDPLRARRAALGSVGDDPRGCRDPTGGAAAAGHRTPDRAEGPRHPARRICPRARSAPRGAPGDPGLGAAREPSARAGAVARAGRHGARPGPGRAARLAGARRRLRAHVALGGVRDRSARSDARLASRRGDARQRDPRDRRRRRDGAARSRR